MSIHNLKTLKKYNYYFRKYKESFDGLAIIAGGAVRDAYHGIYIKDIDIFSCSNSISKEILQDIFEIELLNGDPFSPESSNTISSNTIIKFPVKNTQYRDIKDINEIYQIIKNGVSYNLIIVNKLPTKYVNENFDIGLCKAYYDGSKVHLSDEFMYDSLNKLITITIEGLSEKEFIKIMNNHVRRIQNKYPNHKLIIPEEYKDFYNSNFV